MSKNDELNTPVAASVSRRSLLQGAAAATALASLPWSIRSAYAKQDSSLVIIGGGTAGMVAAIFAADRGANVIVVEKAARLGGTLTRVSLARSVAVKGITGWRPAMPVTQWRWAKPRETTDAGEGA